MAYSLQWYKDEARLLGEKLKRLEHDERLLTQRSKEAKDKAEDAKQDLVIAQNNLKTAERDLKTAEEEQRRLESQEKDMEDRKRELQANITDNDRRLKALEQSEATRRT